MEDCIAYITQTMLSSLPMSLAIFVFHQIFFRTLQPYTDDVLIDESVRTAILLPISLVGIYLGIHIFVESLRLANVVAPYLQFWQGFKAWVLLCTLCHIYVFFRCLILLSEAYTHGFIFFQTLLLLSPLFILIYHALIFVIYFRGLGIRYNDLDFSLSFYAHWLALALPIILYFITSKHVNYYINTAFYSACDTSEYELE